MIRVLHSVSNMDRAGIETMLMNYYRNIDKDKIQFDFLCNKSKIGAYEDEIIDMGGRIYRTPGLNPLKFFKYKKFMSDLFREHPEYKIIHAHNGPFALYALYCAKLSKIPVRIFHGHNSGFPIDLKYPLKLFCKSKLKNNITEKFACGEQAVNFYFGKKVYNSGNYTIVYNAIGVDKFLYNRQIRNTIRNKYNLQGKNVIGHVGRFSPIKNHTFLIKIFEEYKKIDPNAFLILIGDGEQENKIKKIVLDKNINNSVLFLGNIANVNEWYQAFDVFILPSINEGLPVVGIEAQAAGLPCFFSKSVPSEVDVTGNSIFVELSKSPSYWAESIDRVLKHFSRNDQFNKISNSGYNIEIEAKRLERIYIDLYENNK